MEAFDLGKVAGVTSLNNLTRVSPSTWVDSQLKLMYEIVAGGEDES
jgi:hypothetical protein